MQQFKSISKRIVDAQFDGANNNVKICVFKTLNYEYKGYNKMNLKI